MDYHGSLKNYLHAKSKLFQKGVSEKFVYIDSEDSKKIVEISNIESYSIGTKEENNVKLINFNNDKVNFSLDGTEVECELNLSGPKYIDNFTYLDKDFEEKTSKFLSFKTYKEFFKSKGIILDHNKREEFRFKFSRSDFKSWKYRRTCKARF